MRQHVESRLAEWMWRKAETVAVVAAMAWIWVWMNTRPSEVRGASSARPAAP